MTKVILIEPVLPHYRKDVFRTLTESNVFDLEFVAGEEYQGIKSIIPEQSSVFNYSSFRCFGHGFYYLKGASRYIKSKKPDIIICTGVDFHLIHTIYIFIYQRLIKRKRFYWWSHATKGHQGRFGYLIRRFVYRKSTGVLSYNHEGKMNLLEMGISENKIQVVNNSINTEDYGYLNYDLFQKKANGRFTILYSGRVTEAKKVDLLIKALGIIKSRSLFDFICYIVGGGDLDPLKNSARESNVFENIVFTGEKYGKDNHEYFLKSDIFVYPGVIGLSILHAMSFGLPVITTNNIASQYPEFELLLPGINGDVYKNNSVEDLADKISIWKLKSETSGNIITENCINRIKELGYLPEDQSRKVIEFVGNDLPVNNELHEENY